MSEKSRRTNQLSRERKRQLLHLLLSSLAAATMVNVLPDVAGAAALPPSLQGEQFASETTPFPQGFGGSATVVSKTCNADGSGTLSFTADGTTTAGAYPGTFHEDGAIDLAPTSPGGNTFVTKADARFTITSPVGNVSGTESLFTFLIGSSQGQCNFVQDGGTFLAFLTSQQMTYQATITTAQGQFSDSGQTRSTFQTQFLGAFGDPVDKWTGNVFTEIFQTSNGVVVASDSDLALIGVPANISTTSTSSLGAPVSFTPPIADDEETPPVVSCDHASGSTFPIGSTTVTCSATDTDDLNSPISASFTVTVTDNDLALTAAPANISTSATSSSGAPVSFTPPSARDEETPPAVSCDHASGSTFPIGTTTVSCSATDPDDLNSAVSTSFTVTVTDNDLTLSGMPANITTNATSSAGAVVTYTSPTALDESGDGATATAICAPASGSTFPIGTTTVTCSATDVDDLNSPVSASFTVAVANDSDLSLSGMPVNITTNAISSAGAAVSYALPTVVDEAGDGAPATVICAPASGSTFPIGTTTVTCTVQDSDDLNSPFSLAFTVTVVNDSDLALSGVPANITTNATSSAGAVVTYTSPTAVDEAGDGAPATVICVPASGSTFPIGTTTVNCAAASSDDRPSSASATFTITVTTLVDLRLAVSIAPTTATTGTVVTAELSLTSTASVSRAVTLLTTFSYVSPTGQSITITGSKVTFTVAAGQTLARSFTFKVPSYIPRGMYSFSATVSDLTGLVSSTTKFKVI
jgi:HYR domain